MSNENKLSRREFIKDAALGAAAVAGASMLGTTPAQAQGQCAANIPAKWDYEADIVIVGYGGGGVAAAITAKELGASVIVLEKDSVARGGNTGCSGGICAIGATEKSAYEYLKSECWGTVTDDELLKAHASATFNLPKWWESLGAKTFRAENPLFSYPEIPGAKEWGAKGSQANIMKADGTSGAGIDLFQFFRGVAESKGIQPMLNTAVTELIQDGSTKEILGVKALTGITITPPDYHTMKGGKEIFVKAKKAVILACGGYENNHEMLLNWAPHPHSAFVTWYGTPLNTGDGVRMAASVGARLWHMNKKECHSFATTVGSKELGTGRTVSAFGSQIGATASIIVNRDGKRFMNEFFNSGHSDQHRAYDEFEHKLPPNDDDSYSDYRNVPFFWIFDQTRMKLSMLGRTGQWVGTHKIYTWSEDNQAELKKGWFIQADTIEELAKKIVVKDFFGRVVGMDPAGLVATVKKYNEYCTAGKDLDFNRRPATMKPLSTPPFYAMEICECQTNTQGGPERNKDNQTIGNDGKPIPRLYTVGELGSIYGFLYNGGGNVPEAYATGRIAAKHAVTLKPWDAKA